MTFWTGSAIIGTTKGPDAYGKFLLTSAPKVDVYGQHNDGGYSEPPRVRVQRMEHSFREQLERVDRLMTIVEADNPYKLATGLLTIDVIMFGCQSMWHLKDWILNDADFGAKDKDALKKDIYSSRCLLACADLANGSKHLSLNRPNFGSRIGDRTGVHIETSKGIYRELHYVVCANPSDEFHGMEIGTLLRHCRERWNSIINRHWLSYTDDLP